MRVNEAETEAKRLSDPEMFRRAPLFSFLAPPYLADLRTRAEIQTLPLAEHETSSTTFSWILLELALHLQRRTRCPCRPTATGTPLDANTLGALKKLPPLTPCSVRPSGFTRPCKRTYAWPHAM
jgi:hypothetical protein